MKKVLLIAAIIALANNLNAVEISAELKQKLLTQGLSENCIQCISRGLTNTKLPNTPAVEKPKTACLTSKVKPNQAFGDKLTQIEACSQENLPAFTKLCATECDPQNKK